MSLVDFVDSGALPVLETAMKFAARRQEIIAHNIANIETPDFRQVNVSIAGFQRALGEAVEKRRSASNDTAKFELGETSELERGPSGELVLKPETPCGSLLFHDRNNRDLERLMQDQAENSASFRVASDLLRTRFDMLKSAIAQRA